MPNRNQLLIQGARNGMEQFKVEVANELGLQNYDRIDKGELTSRQNGYVGGNITKKLVAYSEAIVSQQGPGVLANLPVLELPEYIRQQNQVASQNFTAQLQQGQSPQQLQ